MYVVFVFFEMESNGVRSPTLFVRQNGRAGERRKAYKYYEFTTSLTLYERPFGTFRILRADNKLTAGGSVATFLKYEKLVQVFVQLLYVYG